MNEEKQIEEMAKDMCDCCKAINKDIAYPPCEDSVCKSVRKHAEALYNKNYRRQDKPNSCGHENGCEWISVEDRLPEENGRYLACIKITHQLFGDLTTVAIIEYSKNHGFNLYSVTETVTHWMPPPEPPKMKGGTE